MKKIILCGLMLCGLPVFGEDAVTTTTNPPTTTPAPSAEMLGALKIRADLKLFELGQGDTSPAAWEALDARINGYQKEFGVTVKTTHNVVLLRKFELFIAKKSDDKSRYDALVQKLAADSVPEVAALATLLVKLKTEPVDLKYTAVDGTAVDVSQMRGKVVLIDFWATWCPPCRGEVPNVVAAYKKYHDQGFEIVGVSLDQDKDALLAFTKDNGMVWPQYFDGKGWDNNVSQSFGINSIPAMWLFDKKGMLVTTDAREDLAGQIEKLLAAP
jgi:thiol-disulfide isomerase/thioredoxin